jgi:adenylate cyclase
MGVDESGALAALRAHRREILDPAMASRHGRIVVALQA